MVADMNRRSFVKGAALGTAATALAAASSALAEETAGCTFADTIAWNAEYDVVVVGFGCAGANAARFAADAGAKVLLVDSAPEGHEGGNSRYCAQLIAFAEDPDAMFKYYQGLAWQFDIDEEAFRVFVEGEANLKDFIAEYYDREAVDYKRKDIPASLRAATPEYPNLEGGEAFDFLTVVPGAFNAALWRRVRDLVAERSDRITVWLESPATKLVQDPYSKAVVGVQVEHDGKSVLVRAKNGVCLTCGGFENNAEMVQDYLGIPRFAPLGFLYNRGAGVKMAAEVGADLWHMHNYEALGMLGGNALTVDEASGRAHLTYWTGVGQGPLIAVGDDGGRFLKEDDVERHGHFYSNGVWRVPIAQYAPHMVFDQTKYDEFDEGFASLPNKEFMASVYKADTIAELAGLIGADPEVLQRTVGHWNAMCEAGVDYEERRAPESMRAFDDGPYYAADLRPVILNTQGGPRRSARAEIVDRHGEPIPHLYSAGELGGIHPFQYQGGGNMAECIIFGRIAGEGAAAPKEKLPVVAGLVAVEDEPMELSAYDFASEWVEVELGENQYLGSSAAGIGGVIQVVVTMDGGVIADVEDALAQVR